MIYIFEDHPDADISVLFKSAYCDDRHVEHRTNLFRKGHGNYGISIG